MSANSRILKSWPIKKYAYAIENTKCSANTNWKYINANEIPMKLSVTAGELIIYTQNWHILEYVVISQSKEMWNIEITPNGIVIIQKSKATSRKILIVLDDDSTDHYYCNQLFAFVCQHIQIKEAPSTSILPNSFQVQKVSYNAELQTVIERCLRDPYFPSFVNDVQQLLNIIVSPN